MTRSPRPRPPSEQWKHRHLLGLDGLSAGELRTVLARAETYADEPGSTPELLKGRTVATMFFEDSTRTRTSFTLAARRLGADVIDLSAATSSVNKGETLIDTARTIEAMGVHAFVVRTRQAGGAALVAGAVRGSVLNAGDGRHEHPTQGLLDILTIARAHGRAGFDLTGLRVAIVGDVANSRVARSGIAGMTALGARVVCVGPPGLAPNSLKALGVDVSGDFDGVLPEMDAVMMLRIQFERHEEGTKGQRHEGTERKSATIASVREYREFYGLTGARAARLKPGAVVLHPGPMNRGIEIDAEVADGPRSMILKQVEHGVFVRMAALALCVGAG
jgi:aspartate carbamoyltransferase catalytic subunit